MAGMREILDGMAPAPAVMVEDEVAAQGPEISEEKIESVMRRHLGLPPLEART